MIYFFSDSHIGSRAMGDLDARLAHQHKVIRMLRHMATDATEIYILGDLFDFWYEYLWRDASKHEYDPVLDELRSMTDRGIHIHFFIGNHDIWTFGYLARRTGMTIHRGNVEHILLEQGARNKEQRPSTINLHLGHGDGLVPSNYMEIVPAEFRRKIRNFMFLRAFFHNPIPQFLFRLVPPCLGNRFGYAWAKSSRLKEEAHPCPYKGENREEIILWAKEQESLHSTPSTINPQPSTLPPTYYIFGHRHIEYDLMLPSRAHVIILGDTFRQWTYARLDPTTASLSLEVYEEE